MLINFRFLLFNLRFEVSKCANAQMTLTVIDPAEHKNSS
jgi:hypothetical protein